MVRIANKHLLKPEWEKKSSRTMHTQLWKTLRKKTTYFFILFQASVRTCARAKERDIKTNHIQTCFHCVSTEVTVGNTNVMPCETKRRGPINVLSHGYWVKSVCYFLSRCNARAFFSSECVSIEEIQMWCHVKLKDAGLLRSWVMVIGLRTCVIFFPVATHSFFC